MKVKEIPHGQYFIAKGSYVCDSYNNIIARKVSEKIVYLNSSEIICSVVGTSNFFDEAESWGNIDVKPIDFQTAILYLVQECINVPPEKKREYPSDKMQVANLRVGEFFLYNNVVARKFNRHAIVCLTDTYPNKGVFANVWSAVSQLAEPVIPLTMHQAVLYLTQQLVQK